MLSRLIKVVSLFLLICLTLSFPILEIEGQHRSHSKTSEITFVGKEETKWIEKREVPLPVIIGQGVKEEPRVDSFDLREDSIGPMKKMSPFTTQPGCAYSGRFTTGIAKVLVGGKALYERGRYRYFEGNYEDAIYSFRKLIEEHPDNILVGSAIYWMGEAKYRQGKDEEAFLQFKNVVENHPKNEFYAYALYSCGWIKLKQGAYEEGHRFFHQVYEYRSTHSIAESSLFWSGYCLYSWPLHPNTERDGDPLEKVS